MQIQKIFSTHIYICISVRMPGKTVWWWIGRGGGYKDIIQSDDQPESRLRAKDISLDWLRARLKGVWVDSIVLDKENSILKIKSLNEEKEIYFGYKDNVFNFIDITKNEKSLSLFFSNSGNHEVVLPPINLDFDIVKQAEDINPLSKNNDWLNTIASKSSSEKERKLTRKIKNIKKDIEKLKLYETLYEVARNPDSLENMSIYNLENIKIKFKKTMNIHQKADLIFGKAKAYKKAIEIQTKRLDETIKQQQEKNDYLVNDKPFALNWRFNPPKNKTKEDPSDVKAQYFFNEDFKIAIGLNAKSNDYLRKTWAKKGDIWVHIENSTGAHLFIKSKRVPDLSEWECFASLLKEYSKYPATEISIVWTENQHVKPIKGKAGLVKFSKEKRLSLNYKKEWMNLLSLRSN